MSRWIPMHHVAQRGDLVADYAAALFFGRKLKKARW